MKLCKRVVASILMISFTGSAVAQVHNKPVSIVVTVDLSRPRPAIDRNIYGQFSEHGVDPTVVSLGAIWITGAPTSWSCRDQTGHMAALAAFGSSAY